jgi:hypothetical protein
MASPELKAFLETVNPDYMQYADALHHATFRKLIEIAAATPEALRVETKGAVPIGPAGVIVAAARSARGGLPKIRIQLLYPVQ